MSTHYAKPLARLVGEFEKLPGIGPKSAQRLAFHVLRIPEDEAHALAAAIVDVRTTIKYCRVCGNFTDQDTCFICTDPRRDQSLMCIVAEARDLIAMEKTNEFRGVYHVLQGVISPMEGVGPDRLRIAELQDRLSGGIVREVILATNPTVEGDTTAMYLARNIIKPLDPSIKITRIAHGMPAGGDLDYADQATLISALEWRRELT
ncbi:MAG: recombination mediator RecR [Capsulimonadaceae bacterium]|nr:recombination mediator RecR [Capsulimonadaceae bacterium]